MFAFRVIFLAEKHSFHVVSVCHRLHLSYRHPADFAAAIYKHLLVELRREN
jgi:hypothetical protein